MYDVSDSGEPVGEEYAGRRDVAHEARARRARRPAARAPRSQALRQDGKADQGIAVLQDVVQKHADDAAAYVALAQGYSDANRGAQAIKVLQDAQTRFPDEPLDHLRARRVLDKQKKFADAEAAFRQLIAQDPKNAPALNYLGYMLAERGERLDESVSLLERALESIRTTARSSTAWAGRTTTGQTGSGRRAAQARRPRISRRTP